MCELPKQWRVDAGLTQRSLAAKLRKPHSYVWKVEAGERRIDPIEFVGWCRACDVNPADAVGALGK
jgi:transcriptional regulator with XRE-family HTH domain